MKNFTFASLLVALLFSLGCGDEIFGPSITSLDIDPQTISQTDVGMTDEFFTVNLSVSNFDDEVTKVSIFRQEPNQVEAVGEVTIDGESIVVRQILKTWFEGVEPGTYNIGAEVESASQSVREFDLATVTVEP